MPRSRPIQVGDIVQLKSGGPRMCVESEPVAGRFRCQWFAGCELQQGVFPEASLILVEENAGEEAARRR